MYGRAAAARLAEKTGAVKVFGKLGLTNHPRRPAGLERRYRCQGGYSCKSRPLHEQEYRRRSGMSVTDVAVVLAHGGWADGSSWSKVIAGLRSEGVKAVAAPLPLTSLADDVAAIDQMLERVEGPVVVAGNAYAGAVIASTGDEKVASLVYVSALAPDEGETVADIFYRTEPHPLAPVLGPDRHGLIWLLRRRSAGLLPSTPRRWSRHCWPPSSGRWRRLASASPYRVRPGRTGPAGSSWPRRIA
jgi:pimeloyl-ACP methyl ester carboxylesterase